MILKKKFKPNPDNRQKTISLRTSYNRSTNPNISMKNTTEKDQFKVNNSVLKGLMIKQKEIILGQQYLKHTLRCIFIQEILSSNCKKSSFRIFNYKKTIKNW